MNRQRYSNILYQKRPAFTRQTQAFLVPIYEKSALSLWTKRPTNPQAGICVSSPPFSGCILHTSYCNASWDQCQEEDRFHRGILYPQFFVPFLVIITVEFKAIGFRYAIIRKPLVCWMAARGNFQLCPTLRSWTKRKKARHNGAAPTKLVPFPIWYHPRSNSSGLLILNTDEVVSYQSLR